MNNNIETVTERVVQNNYLDMVDGATWEKVFENENQTTFIKISGPNGTYLCEYEDIGSWIPAHDGIPATWVWAKYLTDFLGDNDCGNTIIKNGERVTEPMVALKDMVKVCSREEAKSIVADVCLRDDHSICFNIQDGPNGRIVFYRLTNIEKQY